MTQDDEPRPGRRGNDAASDDDLARVADLVLAISASIRAAPDLRDLRPLTDLLLLEIGQRLAARRH